MTDTSRIEERNRHIEKLSPYFVALSVFIGLASFLYLVFGILFAFVNFWFPAEVAEICGYEFSESDYTDLIHGVIGIFSLGLFAIGIWGIRDLLTNRKIARAGVAVFFMLGYSCGVAMMPTSEYAPLVILGLCLLGMNFLSALFFGYIVSELTSE